MIQISQIRLKPDSPETALHQAVYKALRLSPKDTCRIEIAKQSIDSRHKPDILYIYSVHVSDILLNGKKPVDEAAWIKKLKNRDITPVTKKGYTFPAVSRQILKEEDRPVIIGFGPAGMFAALKLAEAGLRPIVFERGDSIEQRKKEVEAFWQGGALNTESNVQFGEGGAGTFSDGKLNTAIKDPTGRIHEVLRIFAEFGADSRILYVNKPHIGTDVLAKVVQNIRKKITACGGEVHFQTKLTAIHEKDGAVNGITVFDRAENKSFTHACNTVCLAIGHSARDTFEMLLAQGISMQPKAFAVGVRMEHPQSFINQNAYGDCHYKLPAADYKVTFQTSTGKGVYSFCMCPGGYVVNASSEPGRLAVNGMSYQARDSKNANSALIVTVNPKDFPDETPLGGIAFQRELERKAWELGEGRIPVQLFGDFRKDQASTELGEVVPQMRGGFVLSNVRSILPKAIGDSIEEGVLAFGKKLHGFDREDALLSGIESRTSSPVRITRSKEGLSNIEGIYPCGEGAGYAGGITSAAMDGIKAAEFICEKFRNFEEGVYISLFLC